MELLSESRKKQPQISPLRFASVGMTRGKVAFQFRLVAGQGKLQIPRLLS
jgi:hypothetical protein